MLRTAKEFHAYAIGAVDGTIGQVEDIYLDDEAWVARYLVVRAGSWLLGNKVLISPIAIGKPDSAQHTLPVSISKEQVRNSPDFDSEKPVTRQHELDYSSYYGYSPYWGSTGNWGSGMFPNLMMPDYREREPQQTTEQEDRYTRSPAEVAREEHADPHLRSCAAITGYHFHASDGEIGRVSGMLIDDETWAVRYLIVDTSNWWLGHHALVEPEWIKAVSWAEGTVSVRLTRQAVKDAPVYKPGQSITPDDEARLHQHYQNSGDAAKREHPKAQISDG